MCIRDRVNNAGTNRPEYFTKIKRKDMSEVVDLNIKASFDIAQLATKIMLKSTNRKKSGGSIINISSASAGPPLSKAFAYSVAKAGIKNLTMNLAREWAMDNVRVNAIRPGFFPTEWNKKNFITPQREKQL